MPSPLTIYRERTTPKNHGVYFCRLDTIPDAKYTVLKQQESTYWLKYGAKLSTNYYTTTYINNERPPFLKETLTISATVKEARTKT